MFLKVLNYVILSIKNLRQIVCYKPFIEQIKRINKTQPTKIIVIFT